MKKFEIKEQRVEQWLTHFYIPELNIGGDEKSGLIENLANEVYKLREENKILKEKLNENTKSIFS